MDAALTVWGVTFPCVKEMPLQHRVDMEPLYTCSVWRRLQEVSSKVWIREHFFEKLENSFPHADSNSRILASS